MWEAAIKSHYPSAVKGSEMTQRIIKELSEEYGVDVSTCLLGSSICSDELNVLTTNFSASMIGPFRMGGLAGYPFGGVTAMTAYAHHVPENGTAVLYYGPHIGVSAKGEIGKVNRRGQTKETSCCGALVGALGALQNFGGSVNITAEDYQMNMLVQMLSGSKDALMLADMPIKELTNSAFQIIHSRMQNLLDSTRKEFFCSKIALVGAVMLNTPADQEDWVDPRHFEVINLS